MRIFPIQNILDGGFVGLGLVDFDISSAQRPEVIQNNMNGDIKGGSRGTRGVWLRMTQLHNGKRVGCSDRNVPSITRVAAGAFGFLLTKQKGLP